MDTSPEKKDLVGRILALHAQRMPLFLFPMKRSHPDLIAAVFAVRPFWGWRRAMLAAGIDYPKLDPECDLNMTVHCCICCRAFEVPSLLKHLRVAHSMSCEDYRSEHGNVPVWSEARSAKVLIRCRESARRGFDCGGALPVWDAPWCPEMVLDRIAEYQTKGVPLNEESIESREMVLINRAIEYFGSWDRALAAMGLDPSKIRRHAAPGREKYPTAQSVLEGIRRRNRLGLPLNLKPLLGEPLYSPKERDVPLWRQACAFFGNWDNAIEAAGLPPQRLSGFRTNWTAEKVLEEIKERVKTGLSIAVVDVTKGPPGVRRNTLYKRAVEFWGSWGVAVKKSGLVPDIRRHTGGKYATKEAVIAEIERRTAAGLPITANQLLRGLRSDNSLFKCGTRKFGAPWSEVLKIALDQAAGTVK